MGNLTSLGDRKTPSRPVQISFGPNLGTPTALKELCLIGHRGAGAASGSSGVANYTVVNMSNVASVAAASGEVAGYVGDGSELAKMVIAAVRVAVAAGGNIPPIKIIPLASGDADHGQAFTAADRVKAELLVSCYDGSGASNALRTALINEAQAMSGPERTENNQFGTFGVMFNRSVTDPSTLPTPDTQYFMGFWCPDTGTGANAPAYSIAEMAAACAALYASNGYPFNPLDNTILPTVTAPLQSSDWITCGVGLQSETALGKGWTPLRVDAAGSVRFVRTVTSRITIDGSTPATAYYDAQDFDALYYFRKTVYTREKQPDFANVKASQQKAQDLKAEMIRLAKLFETDGVFQAVDLLAKQFVVQRRSSDRSTFEAFYPVNVVPGLHNILSNIQATTQFDSFSV